MDQTPLSPAPSGWGKNNDIDSPLTGDCNSFVEGGQSYKLPVTDEDFAALGTEPVFQDNAYAYPEDSQPVNTNTEEIRDCIVVATNTQQQPSVEPRSSGNHTKSAQSQQARSKPQRQSLRVKVLTRSKAQLPFTPEDSPAVSEGLTTRSGRSVIPRIAAGPSASPSPAPKKARKSRARKRNGKGADEEDEVDPANREMIPFSELASNYPNAQVIDVVSFANRSVEERRAAIQRGESIRRECNQFMLYRKAYQEVAKAHCATKHHNQVSIICGTSWRSESKQLRAHFVALAAKDKALHIEAFPDYVYNPKKAAAAAEDRDQDTDDGGDATYGGRRSGSGAGKQRRAKKLASRRGSAQPPLQQTPAGVDGSQQVNGYQSYGQNQGFGSQYQADGIPQSNPFQSSGAYDSSGYQPNHFSISDDPIYGQNSSHVPNAAPYWNPEERLPYSPQPQSTLQPWVPQALEGLSPDPYPSPYPSQDSLMYGTTSANQNAWHMDPIRNALSSYQMPARHGFFSEPVTFEASGAGMVSRNRNSFANGPAASPVNQGTIDPRMIAAPEPQHGNDGLSHAANELPAVGGPLPNYFAEHNDYLRGSDNDWYTESLKRNNEQFFNEALFEDDEEA